MDHYNITEYACNVMSCHNIYIDHYNKLLTIARVFNIKLDYGLSEANYNNTIDWAKNMLP